MRPLRLFPTVVSGQERIAGKIGKLSNASLRRAVSPLRRVLIRFMAAEYSGHATLPLSTDEEY